MRAARWRGGRRVTSRLVTQCHCDKRREFLDRRRRAACRFPGKMRLTNDNARLSLVRKPTGTAPRFARIRRGFRAPVLFLSVLDRPSDASGGSPRARGERIRTPLRKICTERGVGLFPPAQGRPTGEDPADRWTPTPPTSPPPRRQRPARGFRRAWLSCAEHRIDRRAFLARVRVRVRAAENSPVSGAGAGLPPGSGGGGAGIGTAGRVYQRAAHALPVPSATIGDGQKLRVFPL